MHTGVSVNPWYALTVKARHEKAVRSLLEVESYEAFLPLYSCRHKWADRYKTVELPLFPGYVFCRIVAASMHSVLNTPGVVDLVRIGVTPAPLPEQEIEALRRVMQSRLAVDPWPNLVEGERISIVGGPLCGVSGTLTRVQNTLRLVVSVAILQRSVLVHVDRDWVAPSLPTFPAEIGRAHV